MNSAVRTESFYLDSESELVFSNHYYVVNKELVDSLLPENFSVTFKSELVNNATGNVIGVMDEVTFDEENVNDYGSLSYLIDCQGIESGEYYFRLRTSITDEANLYLSDIQRDDVNLDKQNLISIGFNGESIPMTYSLEQNYPNPFNPSTIIRYQLPQDGLVTLKVYDILGSEVATLVNEQKSAGRYEVNFNAVNLSSGVYIYKITSVIYVNSKKMLLIK